VSGDLLRVGKIKPIEAAKSCKTTLTADIKVYVMNAVDKVTMRARALLTTFGLNFPRNREIDNESPALNEFPVIWRMIGGMQAAHKQEDLRLAPGPQPETMLDSIRISGFRSLADFELSGLPAASVLVGPNSSGKTNLIRFFEMLGHGISNRGLGEYVSRNGGADAHLYRGCESTTQIRAEIGIRSEGGRSEYRSTIAHAEPDRLVFAEEAYRYRPANLREETPWHVLSGTGLDKGRIAEVAKSSSAPDREAAAKIVDLLGNVGIYRLGNMSRDARIGMDWAVDDCRRLRSDGGNLAAVLHALERDRPKIFNWICGQVERMVSTFDRFHLENGAGKVRLGWKEKGSDHIFRPHDTSDGTMRIFALYTLLELSREMLPDVLFLDEPDLGLHHWALGLLAGMIQSLSVNRQVIITTQSTILLNEFDLGQVVVVEAEQGRTTGRRLNNDSFSGLIEEAPSTSGQLYMRGSLQGDP